MNEIEKSYNKRRDKFRFNQFDVGNNNDRGVNFYGRNHVEQYTEVSDKLYKHGNMEFVPVPYKPYFLWRLLWFFLKLIKPYHPNKRLDKQSKRHITIVVLMALTILIMLFIAIRQGIFDFGVHD